MLSFLRVLFTLDGPRQTNFTVNGFNYTRIEVKQLSEVTIKCVTHSQPKADYNIQLRPNLIQLNSDVKKGIYTISKIKISQEGIYDCIASNPAIHGKKEKRTVDVVVASKFFFYLSML